MNADRELEAAQDLDRPDDFEFFKSFIAGAASIYKAWALIPAIVFGATVINAFVVAWIVWDWATGRGARHRPVVRRRDRPERAETSAVRLRERLHKAGKIPVGHVEP